MNTRAQSGSDTRRQRSLALVLVTLVVIVSASLVEIVLRVYAGVADDALAVALRADPFEILVEPHGQVGYRPRSGVSFSYENGATATINEAGYRGPLVTVSRSVGTLRVVLLGGSSTFGWGVGDDETIDAHMRDAFSRYHPERSVEVVNLAFDGYDSYQLLERFRSDGLRLTPDVVIVNSGINDVRHAQLRDIIDGDPRTLLYAGALNQLRLEQARGGPTPWTRVKHYSVVARLPALRRETYTDAAPALPESTSRPPLVWDAADYFEKNIDRLVKLGVRGGGAAVLLSTPPSSLSTRYEPTASSQRAYWLHDAATTQVYRDSLAARMRRIALTHAESALKVRYVEHAALSPSWFLDDAHLTSDGNRRMAEDFVRAIADLLATSNPAH